MGMTKAGRSHAVLTQRESQHIKHVRLAAELAAPIRDKARAAACSFADEVMRRLEASFGLHDGSALIVGAQRRPLRRRWRARSAPRECSVWLRDSVRELLNEAAGRNGWTVADEVNSRIQESLVAEGN